MCLNLPLVIFKKSTAFLRKMEFFDSIFFICSDIQEPTYTNWFLKPEHILLTGSVILIISILIGKAGYKFGMPSLLLFLIAGMLIGGTTGISQNFTDHATAQFVGIMALSVILFMGGLSTRISSIKPIASVGIFLATVGVMLTALFTGSFIFGVAKLCEIDFSLAESILLAAVMSSTDSASVFALLRSKGLALRENLRPLLELESGSNDPMAFLLAMAMISLIKTGEFSYMSVTNFLWQIVAGVVIGWGIAKLIVFSLNSLKLENQSIYSVFTVCCAFCIYSFSDLCGGNGYLSVYLAGLVVGNSKFVFKRSITRFFDDFAWLWQIVMFVMLGLLVNSPDLLDKRVAIVGLSVGLFMIFFGRPLSVILCMLPFRKKFSWRAIRYVSWVGLRGAVPIIFATYLFTSGIEHAQIMFNIVFFITILSLIAQGMTVGFAANLLGVSDDTQINKSSFGVELPDEIKTAMVEITVEESLLSEGNTLASFKLPPNTLVMMVRRQQQGAPDKFFVPRGETQICAGDKLLVISDKTDDVADTLNKQGIKHYRIDRDI